ncbi:MAG: ureidoglycolate lyase [Clostridia bacterium]|nr:ureidoglycolate lyase [Clostridia bacterium]
MAKKLEILELTQENFNEFGQVITSDNKNPEAGDENFNWFERLGSFKGIDEVSVNILECKKRALKIDKLELHHETPEAVIPMGGEDVIAVVAPAGKLDESKMKAFRVPAGKGIMLNIGVRHFIPYPLNRNVNCVIVFKHATGANDLIFEQLSEEYEIGG